MYICFSAPNDLNIDKTATGSVDEISAPNANAPFKERVSYYYNTIPEI